MPARVARGIDWSHAGAIGEAHNVGAFLSGGKGSTRAFVLLGLAVAIFLFPMFRAQFGSLSYRLELSFFNAILLTYAFLAFPLGRKSRRKAAWQSVLDWLCIVIVIGTELYILYSELIGSTQKLNIVLISERVRVDYIVGILVCAVLIEATRRTMSLLMAVLPLVFAFYAFFANYFPGYFRNPPVDWQLFMDMMFLEQSGLWGTGIQVLVNMLILFLFFGSLLTQTKTGAAFIAAAEALLGRARGGPAKVAIGGSALFGTMSGSAIANAATIGAITIPMMKGIGYKPEDAAAIEANASNGGQIMPPIMGASAFLIAVYLGIPYRDLVLYAFPPAIIYFLSVYMVVHFKAVRGGLQGTPREQLPSLWRVMIEGGHMAIPIAAFVVLLFLGRSETMVGFWGVLLVLIISFVRKETRPGPLDLLKMIDRAVRSNAGIAVSCVLIGLLIGTINISGLGIKMSELVLQLSAGNLYLALLLSAIFAIILGMGMPTLLVYATLYLFVIPALIAMNAPPLSAHMFAFYFGIVSGVTPPVCMTAFTTAAIAGSPPMKTGWVATRMGFASYVLPFLFIIYPDLLVKDSAGPFSAIAAFVICAVIVAVTAAAIEGFLLRKMTALERGLSFAACIALGLPYIHPAIKVAGVVLIAMVILSQAYLRPLRDRNATRAGPVD